MAAEWQIVVDVTVDIEYPDDGRLVAVGNFPAAKIKEECF